jgi:uncharacterized protein (DUF924 family)
MALGGPLSFLSNTSGHIMLTQRLVLPQALLDFWFGAPGSAGYGEEREVWWNKDPTFDALVGERFGALHACAMAGELEAWRQTAPGCLAYVLLLDQISRHLYRGLALAYAGDGRALSAARQGVEHGLDQELPPFQRQFLYMPFMHSEALAEQERSVALFDALAEEDPRTDQRRWAREYQRIIQRFGRFPHRNALLGRSTRPEEAEFLAREGGTP